MEVVDSSDLKSEERKLVVVRSHLSAHCEYAGNGRQASFKNLCPLGRGGSNPPIRTMRAWWNW